MSTPPASLRVVVAIASGMPSACPLEARLCRHGGNRAGPPDVEALGVIDAVLLEEPDRLVVGYRFGDGLDPEALGDADDRLDHVLVDLAAREVLDEFAVELEVMDRQVLEVVEGAEPGAEVVEGQATTEGGHALGERRGLRHVGDG